MQNIIKITFRLHPFQELSCQNGSFSGTVFSDWILFRNSLFRLDPFQEQFFQIQSFSGAALTDLFVAPAMFKQNKYCCGSTRKILFAPIRSPCPQLVGAVHRAKGA